MNEAMVCPVPGSVPKTVPTAVPRAMGMTDRRLSSREGSMDRKVIFSLSTSEFVRLIEAITSEIPNSPMARAIRLIPSRSG